MLIGGDSPVRIIIAARVSEQLIAEVDSLGFPVVGRSSRGRPIPAGRFGPQGPTLLVVGGVHGNEESSVAAAVELCRWLAAHAPARSVLVLPVLNPDGVVAHTKNSATDVDLNRNFPAGNFRVEHDPGYSPGPAPLSEPETRALAALCDQGLEAVVAIHAPFACVNYDGPAAAWAEAIAASCGWPARADIGYPTPGSLGSWLGRDRGLPVITLELPAGDYGAFAREAQSALQTAINPERIR